MANSRKCAKCGLSLSVYGECLCAEPLATAPAMTDTPISAEAYAQALQELNEWIKWQNEFGNLSPNDYSKLKRIVLELTAARASEEAQDGVQLIAAERRRQMEQEGWTPAHDDEHANGSLADAAACYAMNSVDSGRCLYGRGFWPWSLDWWKPTTPIRDLVKAGALIAAEIDRLQRATLATDKAKEQQT